MNKLYTEENLIAFYYNECDLFTSLEIENAIENNIDVNQDYAGVYGQILNLDSIKFSPSTKSINNILKYSTALR